MLALQVIAGGLLGAAHKQTRFSPSQTCRGGILGALMLVAVLHGNVAAAEPAALCDVRLTVELSPEVPNPRDAGFLSSLLGKYPNYQLILRRQRSDFVLDLELVGPDTDYRCQNMVESLREDARVLFVHAQP
jgi:hypothetical protein